MLRDGQRRCRGTTKRLQTGSSSCLLRPLGYLLLTLSGLSLWTASRPLSNTVANDTTPCLQSTTQTCQCLFSGISGTWQGQSRWSVYNLKSYSSLTDIYQSGSDIH
ncbi:hypothetical protein FA15DRAFT_412661 [Coprinopsis marcescibilis]|uniref:Uncharacterized protein n=1 Tax=Coprinopsis marcescibilis TaxID=230819 RepID=A0A5C3KAB0_COPMA|nr:hypothetical protein FA15DRAFT_412661 [Coprinopsis marcescibilis]